MDVAHQKALHERPHNTHKVGFLERQHNSAMNYSAPYNVEQEQTNKILVISLTFVVCLLLQMNTVEKSHGKCKSNASANQTHPA